MNNIFLNIFFHPIFFIYYSSNALSRYYFYYIYFTKKSIVKQNIKSKKT